MSSASLQDLSVILDDRPGALADFRETLGDAIAARSAVNALHCRTALALVPSWT